MYAQDSKAGLEGVLREREEESCKERLLAGIERGLVERFLHIIPP